MNAKQILLILLSIFFILPIYSQSRKSSSEYRKLYLSLSGGLNYTLGTSNTVLSEDLTLPFTKRIFVPGFDGAWFFTKNYGIGVKYRFGTNSNKKNSYSEYTEQTYEYPVYEYVKVNFNETSHFVGPAFFARWQIGESRWMFLTNAGVGYLHNKLFKIKQGVGYIIHFPDDILIDSSQYPQNKYIGYSDLTGTSVGFSLSAGIHYRIIPLIGIGIDANGLFASVSRMKYKNNLSGKYETAEISRKINRLGLSVAIDFNF